jgi:hypothetical protein
MPKEIRKKNSFVTTHPFHEKRERETVFRVSSFRLTTFNNIELKQTNGYKKNKTVSHDSLIKYPYCGYANNSRLCRNFFYYKYFFIIIVIIGISRSQMGFYSVQP